MTKHEGMSNAAESYPGRARASRAGDGAPAIANLNPNYQNAGEAPALAREGARLPQTFVAAWNSDRCD